MPTQNVNVSEEHLRFVKQSIERGDFRNASEVYRAGLRLLEQQQRADKLKLQLLRRAVKEGFDDIARGDYIALNSDEDIDQLLESLSPNPRRNGHK